MKGVTVHENILAIFTFAFQGQMVIRKIRKGAFINHVDMAGGCQMSISLHKPYLVKWSTKGGGFKNVQKSVHKVYG